MVPFHPAIDEARRGFEDAKKEMWSAHRWLERAGRVKRPTARREAKQADEALKLANDRLDEAKVLAAPAEQKVDAARAAIDNGESSISTLRTFRQWSGNESRRDHLAELDGALLTWREWAAGRLMVDAEIGSAVRTMGANEDPSCGNLSPTSLMRSPTGRNEPIPPCCHNSRSSHRLSVEEWVSSHSSGGRIAPSLLD